LEKNRIRERTLGGGLLRLKARSLVDLRQLKLPCWCLSRELRDYLKAKLPSSLVLVCLLLRGIGIKKLKPY
tara:strand:- start:9899 stop:10111 length:213 start_codon:yes stop_codon:yes gene_type:complete